MAKRRAHEGSLSSVHAEYTERRGRAMSASTVRLRWALRWLPQHTADPETAARRKAVVDELRDRGVAAS